MGLVHRNSPLLFKNPFFAKDEKPGFIDESALLHPVLA